MRIVAALAFETGEPFVIQDVDVAEDLGPHELLVRNVVTGICHTDVTLRDAPHVGTRPIALGHEGAGVVERVGAAVTDFAPGDHVLMTYYSDGECRNCHEGHEAYCAVSFPGNFSGRRLDGSYALHTLEGAPIHGSHHQQSSFAHYSIANDRNAIKVDKDLDLALLAPLGCGFLTGGGSVRNRLKPRAGSSIVIFGMGALGFAAVHMARKAGCASIIAVDLHENRLELAKAFGATHCINASQVGDAVAEVMKTHPEGVDHAFEATGSTKVMEQAIAVLGRGGSCVLSGANVDPAAQVGVSPLTFMKGVAINGTLLGDGDPFGTIGEMIADIREGTFPIDKLVVVYELDQINDAIADMMEGTVIKPVIRFPVK
jgi:aryl-alcohol dehydrogenase